MSKFVKSYRLGEEEERLVQVAAQRSGVPPSTFVRQAAVERAAQVVLGQRSAAQGVAVLDQGAYSHHASDSLCDGWAHNAFDTMRILEHAGDKQAAVQAAREELRTCDPAVLS